MRIIFGIAIMGVFVGARIQPQKEKIEAEAKRKDSQQWGQQVQLEVDEKGRILNIVLESESELQHRGEFSTQSEKHTAYKSSMPQGIALLETKSMPTHSAKTTAAVDKMRTTAVVKINKFEGNKQEQKAKLMGKEEGRGGEGKGKEEGEQEQKAKLMGKEERRGKEESEQEQKAEQQQAEGRDKGTGGIQDFKQQAKNKNKSLLENHSTIAVAGGTDETLMQAVQTEDLQATEDLQETEDLQAKDDVEDLEDDLENFKDDDDLKAEVYAFLMRWAPPSDVRGPKALPQAYIRKNVDLAVQAQDFLAGVLGRKDYVSFKLFLNDVAPYAIFTETRTDWRAEFFGKLSPLLQQAAEAAATHTSNSTFSINSSNKTSKDSTTFTLTDAINVINDAAWTVFTGKDNPIHFIAVPPALLTPHEVIRGNYTGGKPGSSCTGLAIFLVSSLRSVGIAARVAGVPHWGKGPKICPHGDADTPCGNHNWVEVHDGEKWHFLSPPSPGMDKGWFFPFPASVQHPLAGNHSIYATSWRNTTFDEGPNGLDVEDDDDDPSEHSVKNFPMVWTDPVTKKDLWDVHVVGGYDVTCRYLNELPAAAAEKKCVYPVTA